MDIQTILSQIDLGHMALPEFQRGYVWNREQVRALMHSLYRRYPVGSLLVWVSRTENAHARGDGTLAPGVVKLILDGQQRVTSLYGIIRGRPPEFFEGNASAFTGLCFNLEEETFEFYSRMKMQDNPLWIDVTELMRAGGAQFITKLLDVREFQAKIQTYINRLNALEGIKTIDLHIDEVAGDDKTVDVVVDIFNRVNSGGTKLSKGDLALAKVCADWPQARAEMKKRLAKWRQAGFNFRLEWLLRCVNAIVTGEAVFSALKGISVARIQQGLVDAERAIDSLLDLIASRLGLDHDRVLGSRYSFPLMARYLIQRGGRLEDYRERDKLLYWYIHTFLWGRYAGSTETVLNQDLAAIEQTDGGLDRLIDLLRQSRGDLRLNADDFRGHSRGARFYPLLYMMTRVGEARDWVTGVKLAGHLLGRLSVLQVHHIFPKALLYRHGYKRAEVNAIANFTFLTQDSNLLLRDREPADYLAECQANQPGALESHCIPMDRDLWRVENYLEFLAARRELLARAANDFLDGLLGGLIPERRLARVAADGGQAEIPGGVETDEEQRLLVECKAKVMELGLPEGQMLYELADPKTGQPLAILDLAWPDGLQEGLSQPVALLIGESEETREAASQAGFRLFTSVDAFMTYVKQQIMGAEPAA